MSGTVKKDTQKSLKFVYSENNTLSVIFHDNNLLMGIVGEFNKNLKELEKITGASLYSRGNSILIKSSSEKNEIDEKCENNCLCDRDQLIHAKDSRKYFFNKSQINNYKTFLTKTNYIEEKTNNNFGFFLSKYLFLSFSVLLPLK